MKFILQFVFAFLCNHVVVYLLGSWIAFDFNPTHWWLFTSTVGRVLACPLELSLLGMTIKMLDK